MLLYPRTDRQARFIALAASFAPTFRARAPDHDRDGSFPFENFADLRAVGYQGLPVSERFGGLGADLLETVLAQLELGRADGSTALTMNMHLSTIGTAGATQTWPPELYERIAREVAQGALINSAAAEPELGSPASGGLPATRARRTADGWRISGRKTFVSGCALLTYFLVPAHIEDSADPPHMGTFLVPTGLPGIRIEPTWDTLGMRATGSDDVLFEEVAVPTDALLNERALGKPDPRAAAGGGWGPLLVSAVYLGVATAARDFAIEFARERTPTALARPIAELPAVQWKVADMEIALLSARTLVLSAAEDWVACPERRGELGPKIAAAKTVALNNAISVTDIALRLVGGVGLHRDLPLERYFRDVRAGLSHPPLEDRAKEQIGKAALGQNPPPLRGVQG